MKHIFKMLQTDVKFTMKVEDFIAHSGPKITYTKQPLQSEFFVKSHPLLFEQGISDVEITMAKWDDVPCFFPTNDKSTIPFDVFAASFYMLSRYEEYLPYVKDEHGRYPATESLAFKNDFLKLPVVDFWILKLKTALQDKFPDTPFGWGDYQHVSVIDVASAYAFRKKGVVRNVGGALTDAFQLKFNRIAFRILVLAGLKKDPLDVFDELIKVHKKKHIEAVYFFLLGDYSGYDKNVSYNKTKFRTLIKSVADYSIVSLMASYTSTANLMQLKEERKRLINIVNRPVKRVRLRFNRLTIPESYRMEVDAEFNEDYTMGYTKHLGFRAGTCTPFQFYDISFEEQLPLKVNPFCIQYTALNSANKEECKKYIHQLKSIVKRVDGKFITVFSNEVLDFENNSEFKKLYIEEILND
ncbi:polysaccharide deacetylase family protein [Zhouia sp. PK063]|uniref:polysaccharide deacetylase family protein n=1 Tax=Zhouia sp. PK063 TaxID=3373602 RepID=UPI00378F5DEC